MTKTCPYCLASDLLDGARKCAHCGSWLDEGSDGDPLETYRRNVREELRSDLLEHRGLIETMLKRIQLAGGIIVTAALGAALFFGYTTDKSITETSDRISRNAEVKIQSAAAEISSNAKTKIEAVASDITESARQEVRRVVTEKLASAEIRALIDKVLRQTLEERVRAEVDKRFTTITATVDRQMKDAEAQLGKLESQIAAIKTKSAEALKQVAPIQASFEGARKQTVQSAELLLPVDFILVHEKAGPDQLAQMLERGVDALSYRLGAYYYGPMVWRYFERLKALPQFRHVLILSTNGTELVAMLDAATLTAHLDPPNSAELSQNLGTDPGSIPGEEDVPKWTEFARWLSESQIDRLRALPSFRHAGKPVRRDDGSLDVLTVMEQRRADFLPVIDENDRFVGVVDRSRLTARLLLAIATPRN